MTSLEWLTIILVYAAAYGLWSALVRYRENAPYRSKRSRRLVRFGVLTLLLVGLGAVYNSASVQRFFQTESPETSSVTPDTTTEPAEELGSASEGSGEQPAPEKSTSEVAVLETTPPRDLAVAALPNRAAPKVEASLPSVPPARTQRAAPASDKAQDASKPATAPQTPKPFKIEFQSDPAGATLYISSERVGVTPIELSLAEDEPLLYTLRAEEGVANYRLYHPYSNTLTLTRDTSLSVWLERLNREEAAALQERQRRKDLDAIQLPQLSHVSADTTRYQIITGCSEGLDLTYTNKAQRVVQERGRKDGWAYGFVPKPGQFLYLYARSNCASGYLTVQLVQNGEVLQENTATGKNAIATISTYW